jgi:hypothetical protein
MGLWSAIEQLADTAGSGPSAGDPAEPEAQRHANYHKRIVFVGGCFAALGVVLGLLAAAAVASDPKSGGDARGILLVPVIYGAGGFVFGMAIMCLVAPRAFLTGPVGAPWMKMIGTKDVLMARIACLLFGLVVTIPLVGMGLLIALAKHR